MPLQTIESSPSTNPLPPIDSHHSSVELSLFTIFGILFVAIVITISISLLIRCLRARSLLPLLRRLFAPQSLGDCAICFTPLQPKDQLRHLPLCSHAFHEDCISTWLASSKTCPLCRSPLDHAAADTAAAAATASIAAGVGHDGSRSLLRDLSRGISYRSLSFRSSSSFFTGSSRRLGAVAAVVDLEAGQEISEYFWWLSPV